MNKKGKELATLQEVEDLSKAVLAALGEEGLVKGNRELDSALASLLDDSELGDFVRGFNKPAWQNVTSISKLVWLARLDEDKIVSAIAEAIKNDS